MDVLEDVEFLDLFGDEDVDVDRVDVLEGVEFLDLFSDEDVGVGRVDVLAEGLEFPVIFDDEDWGEVVGVPSSAYLLWRMKSPSVAVRGIGLPPRPTR